MILIDWEFIWDGGIGGACSLEINSEAFCWVFFWKADVLDSQGPNSNHILISGLY